MSKLYYTCFRHMAVDDFGRLIAAPMGPSLAEGQLDITHENQVSEPFPQYTSFISIKVTADCAIAFGNPGDIPEAHPDFHFVGAGEYRFYGAQPGSKIAVIEVVPTSLVKEHYEELPEDKVDEAEEYYEDEDDQP